jgi:small subunit ribosomal protein S14
MARASVKARQRKREATVKQFAEKRAALKAANDYAGLDKLPKNASPVRLKNRCQLTGRPRGYLNTETNNI